MIKVKVPHEIQIGSHTYKISFEKMVGDDGHDATTNHRKQEIWMAPDTPSSRISQTLIHELLHVIRLVYPTELTERDVECLAQGLAQFLFSDLGIELDWSDVPGHPVEISV